MSVADVTWLDPIEHSGVEMRTETISAYLPRIAGWHVAVGPSGTVSSVPSGSAILVDPGGRTHLPGDGGPKFGPDVREDDLVLGAAVLLPANKIARVTLSPGEVRVSNCDVTIDGNITAGLDSWTAPGMIGSSSGVVGAGCAALPRCTATTTRVDEYTEGNILDQYETFNGMPAGLGSSTLHQVQVQVQVLSFFILQVQVQVQ